MVRFTKKLPLVASFLLAGLVLSACGSEGVSVSKSDPKVRYGAELFAQRCSGCHTLSAAGAQGSATRPRDKEKTDGPNLDQRKETIDAVLYAVRNGGFSGRIMPQNIVVGPESDAVASFVAKYAGVDAKSPVSPRNLPR